MAAPPFPRSVAEEAETIAQPQQIQIEFTCTCGRSCLDASVSENQRHCRAKSCSLWKCWLDATRVFCSAAFFLSFARWAATVSLADHRG